MRILYQAPVSFDWIRQRPHFVAEGLANLGHSVLWFYTTRLDQLAFRHRKITECLSVLEVPILPFASRCRLIEWLNRLWIAWVLHRTQCDLTIVTHPTTALWLPRHLRIRVVYDCMDIQTAFFKGCKKQRMQRAEALIVNQAVGIVASSERIKVHLEAHYAVPAERITIITNGANRLATAPLSPVPVHNPVIRYFGTISSWIDWAAVLLAAKKHTEWSFDFYGPLDKRSPIAVTQQRNIHFYPPVPHSKLFGLMSSASALIIPFIRNELIEGVDPVKMYEYLQTGRPIVSAWWPQLDRFQGLPALSFYRKAADFPLLLEKALAQTQTYDPPWDFLSQSFWPQKIAKFNQCLLNAQVKRNALCLEPSIP